MLEVSFAIPAGCSGAPAYAFEHRGGVETNGLIGVCLGNHQTVIAEHIVGIVETTLDKLLEYGIVANLWSSRHAPIEIADGLSLEELLGPAPRYYKPARLI